MNYIKSHWQILLICLLSLFGLSKCTQSCNRQGAVDQVTSEYSEYKNSTDSLLVVYQDSIKTLNSNLIIANNKIEMMQNTLNELKVSTDALTKVNDNLSKQRTQVIIRDNN